jgi:tetratricopeptide (TPR) repeat protein
LPEIDLARVDLALWNRDPDALLRILRDARIDVYETQLVYFPSSLYAGWAHRLEGDDAAAVAAFDSARVTLEALIAQNPDDERLISSLGYAYAGLGRRQDAADSAVRAMRARQRAGREISDAPARILAQANLPDVAVPYLEAMLEAHSPFSTETMKLDPLLDPIREDPAFVALMERFGGTR